MSLDIDGKIIIREPLKLLKNKLYPTFQLYGEIEAEKLDLQSAFIIAILETMSWLRKRFREIEIPKEIDLPNPEEYQSVDLKDLKSFRMSKGYVLEVVYLNDSEKISWSLHIIEPDLGPEPGNALQERQPVAGRIFTTNIAFIIYRNKLECGFKTICSEPEITNVLCEVFRMAVVKSIVRNKNIRLKQIYPIVEEAYTIDNLDKTKRLKDFINNRNRQLPIVIVAEYEEKFNILDIDIDKTYRYRSNVSMDILDKIVDRKNDNIKLPLDMGFLSRLRMGYGQFFIIKLDTLDSFNRLNPKHTLFEGDIRIIDPLKFENANIVFKKENIIRDKGFVDNLANFIQEYPKYKDIDFGNIMFYRDARIAEQEEKIRLADTKEKISEEYEIKIEELEKKYKEELDGVMTEVDSKGTMITKLKEQIKGLEEKVKLSNGFWEEKNRDLERNYAKIITNLENQISRKDLLLDRPKKIEDIPDWVERYFEKQLIFHNKAIDLIKRLRPDELNIDLLCDAIEYLAYEYRDERMGLITEEEKNNICNKKYNRPFSVTLSGDASIRNYPSEYKIKYKERDNGKLGEVLLDLHLKVGKGKENLLRIYFHYDKDNHLVVVGSLPYHLKSINK